MKKITTVLLYVILVATISFTACSGKTDSRKKAQIENIHEIDLDKLSIEKEIAMSSFFYKATPIFPGYNDSILIGDIGRMQVFDDKIYILDISADNKLCVFDKAGRFLYQIGDKGNGPGEYINATDFTIDRKDKKVYILDNKTGNIIKYRAEDGQPEGSLLIEDFRTSSGIQFHNGRLYIDANSKENGKDGFLLE
ncbi:MAG: 6-bladed beta-propeller, partial [Prevotella sp.]|nr:6-bladed beta-propeller [Prevotella sp.]